MPDGRFQKTAFREQGTFMSASSAHSPEACSLLPGRLQLPTPCIWAELCNVHPETIALLNEVFWLSFELLFVSELSDC